MFKTRYTQEPLDPKHPPQWLIQVSIRVYDMLWKRAERGDMSPTQEEICVHCRDSIYAIKKALWLLETGNLIKIKRCGTYHEYYIFKLGKKTRSRADIPLSERTKPEKLMMPVQSVLVGRMAV